MMGFTYSEVRYILEKRLDGNNGIDKEKIFEELEKHYNGYLFSSRVIERIFNPDMILYYFTSFEYEENKSPERMLDSNIVSDCTKIRNLFNIKNCEENFKILDELIKSGKIKGSNSRRIFIRKKREVEEQLKRYKIRMNYEGELHKIGLIFSGCNCINNFEIK
ncbi:MAG TPA: AAA family ATPase [bacterium]|nr:AAA family ATPase [bacterium]HOL47345.1 AAA family ATPase [bacterium]HPQ17988.1 AAA family ATPase [bacterium]